MARPSNRVDNEVPRPLDNQPSADQRRLDVGVTRPPGPGAGGIRGGHDYEYDEAHDVPAGPLSEIPPPHPVSPPPKVDLGQDGDYGYDEAHDFGAS
jgi:hypothetical protein